MQCNTNAAAMLSSESRPSQARQQTATRTLAAHEHTPTSAFAAFAIALLSAFAALMLATTLTTALTPTQAFASDTQDMHRLYNPNSGEHFYTASTVERDNLRSLGWNYESVGWVAPSTSNTPVYRLYNPNAGDHHYTTSAEERDYLVSVGWNDEGIGWYSDDAQTVKVLRQYNPNAVTGAHNFTTSAEENDNLVSVGWRAEGIGWYAVSEGHAAGEPIMGSPIASVAQMVACYNSTGKAYPAEALSKGGAATINDFCQQLYNEAVSEGVRPEVVFAQAMHETGWLQFGGDVKVEQFNFAGLGATGGVPGNSFSSVAEGLLAQVQHLKAYASTDALNNPCVDVRFSLVKRGCAPYVEDLGGKWAVPGVGYADAIIAIMNRITKY